MHVIAAKAVAFKEAGNGSFKKYQSDIVENAKILAGHLMEKGIDLVSDGTDNHMMLADLRKLGITGKAAENVLGRAGITVNKNTIPFETQKAAVTSGIRIGTPAVTTRGMKTGEMAVIGECIVDVLKNHEDEKMIASVLEKVHRLCESFPLFREEL